MSHNLPTQLTRFIGRQDEIAAIKRIFADARLLTLTGPGGSGKTRLAIEVARQLEDSFEDGIVWVDLTSLSDETLVTQTVATALGLREQSGKALERSLADFLSSKHLLLLLDNCEHLITACAQLMDRMLRACPNLSVMATSLEPLRVPGEYAWPVPPLSVPADSSKTTADLQQYEAVTLFLDRARSVSPRFSITDDNGAAVSRICRRLDGMPLAIELAASRVNMLAAEQIADRLDDRFSLLKSETRTITHPRHHTLRATIDWSYNLLSAKEQTLLSRLAVFETGCNLEATEATCAGEGVTSDQILELLSSLVSKSLISVDTTGRAQAHYRLLESIQAYALEKLNASGEENNVRDRHLDHYVAAVDEATPNLVGTYQELWFNWLVSQQDDIRAALRWSLASGRIESGLRILIALSRSQYWAEHSYVQEWQKWLEQLLNQSTQEIPLRVRLEALTTATSFSWLLGHDKKALQYGKQAIPLAEEFGDVQLLASALGSLARAYAVGGDHLAANQLNQRVAQIYRTEGDWLGAGYTSLSLALDAITLGQFESARIYVDECLDMARISESSLLEAHAYNILGELEFCRDNFNHALGAYETSLPVLLQSNAERDAAAVILRLGYTHLELGDLEQARQRFRECLDLQQKLGNQQGMAECLTGYGALAVKQGASEFAANLLCAAISLTGAPAVSIFPTVRYMYERYLFLAREQLTETSFIAAQQQGRQLSMEQALELVNRHLMFAAPTEPSASGGHGDLTPRQREVAALIAQGKSNGQIAEELVLSKRTVEKHITNIRAALKLQNRAEIIRWAIENRLMDSSFL
jgi:predicted ATPase/DNA-binding CsgD family transcriptional regulator/Tfp pilus assembly protein PilF